MVMKVSNCNALFLSIFGLVLLSQICLAFRYRTWGVSIAFLMGLAMEICGYIGRILMHGDPFWKPYFLLYLIDLTIGPTLIAAGIYLCMARIVVVYDGGSGSKTVARMRPRGYTLVFMGWDFLSLLLQAVGGAIASLAVVQSKITLGTNIMVAGLAVQVVSLAIFMALCADLARKVHGNREKLSSTHADLYTSRKFKIFLSSLALATVCIFIRSVFRVAELSGGFKGRLASNQVSFMILDGVMVIIASFALTIYHPGRAFGMVWREANFTLWAGKRKESGDGEMEMESSEADGSLESGKGNAKEKEDEVGL